MCQNTRSSLRAVHLEQINGIENPTVNFLNTTPFPQSISPGAVKTEIFKPELLDLLPNIPFLDPEDVSQAVMYALATRPHVQVK